MHVFDELTKQDHEQVVFCNDKESGLRAIIAIHNTDLGPALGVVACGPMTVKQTLSKML